MEEIIVTAPNGAKIKFPKGTTAGEITKVMQSFDFQETPPEPLPAGRTGSMMDTVDATMRGAADMGTFGGADEAAAGMQTLTGVGSNVGPNASYDENLAAERAIDKHDEKNHFWARTAGQLGMGLATARVLPNPETIAGTIAQGGALGGAYGFGSGEGGAGNRAENAVGGGIIGGAAGGVLATGIKAGQKLAKPIWDYFRGTNAGKYVVNGQLTQEGEMLAELAGIDPSIAARMGQRFADRAKRTKVSTAGARQTAADEFGIPLTKGQAKGDYRQIAFEKAAETDARGRAAGAIMRNFNDKQGAAVERAGGQLRQEVANGTPDIPTDQAAGARLLDGVKTRANQLDDQVGEAYEAAGQSSLAVPTAEVQSLPARIRQRLEAHAALVDGLTPAGQRALAQVDEIAQSVSAVPEGGGRITAINLKGIERTRQKISRAIGLATTKEDRRVATLVKHEFDSWLDDTIDAGLFEGDDAALDLLKNARDLRSQYGRQFEKRPGDRTSALMQKMVKEDATAQEVANWLYGATQIGKNGDSARLAKHLRGIFGGASEEWAAVRQGAIARALRPTGKDAEPQAVVSSLRDFLNGKGAPVARELFSSEQRIRLAQFMRVMESMIPPKGTVNHSGTANEIARLWQDAWGTLGADGAPLTAKLIFRTVGRFTSEGRNAAKARKATGAGSGFRLPERSRVPTIGAGAAVTQTEAGRE